MATKEQRGAPGTSRIGKRPVDVPAGVAVRVDTATVEVKGPKGTLSRQLPAHVAVAQDGGVLRVSSSAPGRSGARLQGLARALLANMVKGVTEGYERTLELHGTGYRAEVAGNKLNLSLGFSHPIEFAIPEGLTVNVPADSKGSLVVLQGLDKELVGQAAATIRAFRPPEPYGGKGVRYRGERVREKAGKAGK
jgi:large subunit ribosomal protein L6